MKVWYLAHPIAADDQFTTEQNLDHIKLLIGLLWSCGWIAIAPYHTQVLAVPDSPQNRKLGLECDYKVIDALGGKVILAGHRVSSGMEGEINTAERCVDCEVVDLVGKTDSEIIEHLAELNGSLNRTLAPFRRRG